MVSPSQYSHLIDSSCVFDSDEWVIITDVCIVSVQYLIIYSIWVFNEENGREIWRLFSIFWDDREEIDKYFIVMKVSIIHPTG